MLVAHGHEAGILCEATGGPMTVSEAIVRAKCLVSKGVGLVIVTLAELGVCYATSQTSGNIPAIQTDTDVLARHLHRCARSGRGAAR